MIKLFNLHISFPDSIEYGVLEIVNKTPYSYQKLKRNSEITLLMHFRDFNKAHRVRTGLREYFKNSNLDVKEMIIAGSASYDKEFIDI